MTRGTLIAGLVLAGGRSSRFGRPKALAVLGGETLAMRMARLLGNGCGAVAFSVREADLGADVIRLTDPPGAPEGPLAGILAGLRWAESLGARWLVTAPCDTPLLPEDFADRLVAAAVAADAEVAAFSSESGLHPLTAAWRTSLLPALEADLAEGHPPVHAFVESRRGVRVHLPEDQLLNINTPADLEIARSLIGAPGL